MVTSRWLNIETQFDLALLNDACEPHWPPVRSSDLASHCPVCAMANIQGFPHTAVFVLTLFNSLAWNWILNLCFLFQGFSVVPGLQQYLFEPPRNIPSTISINSISIKLKHIRCLYTLSVFLESTKTKYFFVLFTLLIEWNELRVCVDIRAQGKQWDWRKDPVDWDGWWIDKVCREAWRMSGGALSACCLSP